MLEKILGVLGLRSEKKISINNISCFDFQIISVVAERLAKNEHEKGAQIPRRWFLPTYFAVSKFHLRSLDDVQNVCNGK